MPEFKVYGFEQRVGGRIVPRVTFDQAGGFPCIGTITAPPGSTLYRPTGRSVLLLKVPKTQANPMESYVYGVRDAVIGAKSGELDLIWTPAPQPAPTEPVTR